MQPSSLRRKKFVKIQQTMFQLILTAPVHLNKFKKLKILRKKRILTEHTCRLTTNVLPDLHIKCYQMKAYTMNIDKASKLNTQISRRKKILVCVNVYMQVEPCVFLLAYVHVQRIIWFNFVTSIYDCLTSIYDCLVCHYIRKITVV